MKNQKTQSKLLVAMTAVILLLVALSATLTFAYFTASTTNTDQKMQFGTLKLSNNDFGIAASGGSTLTNLVPGDKIGLSGESYIESSIDYFLRAKLEVVVYDEGYATLTQGNEETDEAFATRVANNKADHDISGKDPASFANAVNNTVVKNNLTDAENEASSYRGIIMALLFDNSSNADEIASYFLTDGKWMTATSDTSGWKYYEKRIEGGSVASPSELRIFDIDTGVKQFAVSYSNAWQGVQIVINIAIQAVQADHINFVNAVDTPIMNETSGENVGKLSQASVNTLAGLTSIWGEVASGNNVVYTHAS